MKTVAQSGFHQPIAWALLSLLGAAPAVLILATRPAMAQTVVPQNADPLQDVQRGDRSTDPFSGGAGGGLSGLMQLMHQAQQGQIQSGTDFDQEQQKNLGSSATDFRARQLQLLQQQNPSGANTSVTAPPAAQPQTGSN